MPLLQEILNDQQKMIYAGVGLFVLLESVVCLIWILRSRAFLQRAVTTTASITKIENVRTSKTTYDRLHVKYTNKLGRTFEGIITAQTGQYRMGGQLDVLYDPEKPETVKSTQKLQFFMAPLAALLGAIMVMAIVAMQVLGIKL